MQGETGSSEKSGHFPTTTRTLGPTESTGAMAAEPLGTLSACTHRGMGWRQGAAVWLLKLRTTKNHFIMEISIRFQESAPGQLSCCTPPLGPPHRPPRSPPNTGAALPRLWGSVPPLFPFSAARWQPLGTEAKERGCTVASRIRLQGDSGWENVPQEIRRPSWRKPGRGCVLSVTF